MMGRLSLAASSTPGAERRLLFPFRVWAERSAQRSNAAVPVVTARESRHPPATALTFSALADLIRRLFMFCSLTALISSRREEEEGRGKHSSGSSSNAPARVTPPNRGCLSGRRPHHKLAAEPPASGAAATAPFAQTSSCSKHPSREADARFLPFSGRKRQGKPGTRSIV